MKCPYCKNIISEKEKTCPNCKINIEDYIKNSQYTEDKFYKKWWFWLIVCALIWLCYSMLAPELKNMNKLKLESRLIQENKITYGKETVEKFAEYLKNKNYYEIKKILSDNCIFYKDNNKKQTLESCIGDIKEREQYKIEKRENDIKDEETYRIYWDGNNSENAKKVISLFLRKNVKKDKIVYEIYQINFNNN